jgi:hypothetical protein
MTPTEERFWSMVEKTEGCWNWTGYKTNRGYGGFSIGGGSKSAHRTAWFLYHGSWPPKNLCVCHHCDNPLCVRKEHLFLGTLKDNTQDCIRKGRDRFRGERNGRAKLSEQNVHDIRTLLEDPLYSQTEIARKYSVHQTIISDIKNNITWKSLPRRETQKWH